MRVRRIQNGDYHLGHGEKEFLVDTPEAVAQCVSTRLALWSGSWFLNTEAGTPWIESMDSMSNVMSSIIRARILGTPGVTEITDFESVFNPDTRQFRVTATINTEYGKVTISEEVSNGN